ncbi:MAG: FAD-dependent oxidoreductase [Victivallaceae bacterium]|nr:FAD-dependent oxidoreductase [Victivallaceae bacterium]
MQNNLFNCDVLVVGAGAAGCAAAVTAAENCCSTLLIDRCSSLGGTYRAARLNTVCGLYLSHADDNTLKILPSKFIERWLSRVQTHDKSFMPRRAGRLYTAPCNSELMTVVLVEAIAEQSKHLTYLPSMELNSVTLAGNSITELNAVMADGNILTIRPKTVIDCSGSGAIIKYCQHAEHGGRKSLEPRMYNSDMSTLAAIHFTLDNCQYSEMLSLKTTYELSCLAKESGCPAYWRFVVLRNGENNNEINGWFNFPSKLFNSAVEVKTEICSMFELLRERMIEFKSTQLRWSGDEICLRDAPVIDGMNCLTAADIINGIKQADATLCGSWPIELWDVTKGQQLIYPPINDYYNITDDCLKSAFCSNLFAAGKGVAATPEAQAAIRVTGLAFATGERAAMLASKFLN